MENEEILRFLEVLYSDLQLFLLIQILNDLVLFLRQLRFKFSYYVFELLLLCQQPVPGFLGLLAQLCLCLQLLGKNVLLVENLLVLSDEILVLHINLVVSLFDLGVRNRAFVNEKDNNKAQSMKFNCIHF